MAMDNLFRFGKKELIDLLLSTFAIAMIFAWPSGFSFDLWFFILFVIYLFTVGAGFILHELAHRTVARHFGAWSEFRAWYEGLALGLLLKIILGFTFIAPGAVYIYKDYLTTEENGIIALAGPLTNVALAFFFLMLNIPIISDIGYHVNLFLAAFNMLPIPPFDGSKVIHWNILIWAIVAIPMFLWAFGLF
ncbi:hypothetical protein [Methanotorris formicicus]|uniref:Peptidase M50 n=1 Tax=Methanotorris formicicus Mc-S-70 TaxID=647171 RepID=H1L084_9EURY|nr:hypothetical protein [Methanotorris formicicus]EHP85135.1 peptidase M50 [Methanotorris formicicus Mc-S-70]